MIITRSPLRISLGGGGTDLPSYYSEYGGFVISAAIDKYVYITLHETFQQEIIVKYSRTEVVARPEDIRHPIIREALLLVGIDATPHLEISAMADIPAGTGLGSSGSFTTALLRALYMLKMEHISRQELAERACHIELERLGEPVGKQDQYIASFGGITCFRFHAGEQGDLRGFAELMQVHWEHKRRRTEGMSNSTIDQHYELARRHGALGGKLIGAGGGGFLMFYTEDKTRLRRALTDAGLREVRMRFDFQGTTVMSQA